LLSEELLKGDGALDLVDVQEVGLEDDAMDVEREVLLLNTIGIRDCCASSD